MINISTMTLDDLKLIEPILNTAFDEFWKPESLKSELLNKNSKCIVAKNNSNEILGFASIWKSVDDIHITNIVVRKDLRKQGIGSILLEKLIEISKTSGITSLTLEVNHTNTPAIELYTKARFQKSRNQKKILQQHGRRTNNDIKNYKGEMK
ncbi:MAG: ribosomal protein S18-alanine N-acetyltransferase [Oscillospiraceae bacterium]|nr:ribosomal protein S18-alanine N-acetyltransferase [Oscillospiraceae bacterium]